MKRFVTLLIQFSILFTVSPLAAKASQPQYNTIVVKHFTNANGMNQSQNFINMFCDNLRTQLVKNKYASQAVEEGVTVSDSIAANSLLIDGKFTGYQHSGMIAPGKLLMEISIYRLSDHALVKTAPITSMFVHNGENNEKVYAYYTGTQTAGLIQEALKGISLSSIPPAPPGANQAAIGATPPPPSGTAQTGPESVASVQLSSDPTGAEITIDGNYVGSTPSQINLKPGTHSIKMTLNGYLVWVRSIDTEGGESRNIVADLEKTSP
jgi:hypothetical protein